MQHANDHKDVHVTRRKKSAHHWINIHNASILSTSTPNNSTTAH